MEKVTHLSYPVNAVYLAQVMLPIHKSRPGEAWSRNCPFPYSHAASKLGSYLIFQWNFLYL